MSITQEECQELLNVGIIDKAEYDQMTSIGAFSRKNKNQSQKDLSEMRVKPKSRKTAAFLAIFLGSIWAQKLYLKKINGAIVAAFWANCFSIMGLTAFIMSNVTYTTMLQRAFMEPLFLFPFHIVITLLSILLCINAVLGLIEGTIYFTLSDEEFQELYVDGTRKWF